MSSQGTIVEKLLTLILALAIVPIAAGQVTLKVYEADEVTPFDCNEAIMVGTKLTLIVSSDSNDTWSGGLFIADQNRALGVLAGREWDPNAIVSSNNKVISGDWTGSHFEEAGDMARVLDWNDSSIYGFDLYSSVLSPNDWPGNPNAGDWFIIDYYAEEVGDCNVGFYDYSIDWNVPAFCVTFSHVPTRDLNFDGAVNFNDFAIFALQWYTLNCTDPNWCVGADIDRDGYVDYNDLELFVEYWLWPTSPNFPNEPNEPNYPEDPNIIFRIVDANGSSEITIDVNESITLYVTMETNDVDVSIFDVEIDISNTNLGSIDNTGHPNGTAEILATLRDPFFDYWGPGVAQEEGIELAAASFGSAISDGHLASFVFTCEGYGDVTLTLINWIETILPTLESITIHQIDLNSQPMMMGGEMVGTSGIDDLVEWLEGLWSEEKEVRENFSKREWDEFIDSVKNSYQ